MNSTLQESMIAELAIRPRSFAWLMEKALYDPDHGYYGAGKALIGRKGDFLTSAGPAFARLLLWQFCEMWELLGKPPSFTIVEQGAHEGLFAAGVLAAAAEDRPEFFAVMRYHIIEPSAIWQGRQSANLESWNDRVRWSESPTDMTPVVGVHFSNELADAFPVRVVRWNGTEWNECFVIWTGKDFDLEEGAVRCTELKKRLTLLPTGLPVGYTTEVNLRMVDWIQDVARIIEKGFVLLADYGRDRASYYDPSRTGGTLRAFAAHQRFITFPEIMKDPGNRDITTDVEFTTLIDAGIEAGMAFVGETDQHHFLVGVGEPEFEWLEKRATDFSRFLRSYQALIHPGTMGSSFYFLCFSKGLPDKPALRGYKFS